MAARVESLEERRTKLARRGRPQPVARKAPKAKRPVAEEAGVAELLLEAARILWRSLSPDVVGKLKREVDARMRRIPTQLNGYGYDPWGLSIDTARRAAFLSSLLYRYYFRVESHGIENLPSGRVLVIGNHAGQVAIDAAMIGTAALLEAEPPRILRGMGEYWLPTVPFVSILMTRTGSVVGTPKNCVDLLQREEAVIAFPEGVRGMNKVLSQRYHLQRFGTGFMRLALATGAPIVPVAVVGSEEQAPGIANLQSVAKFLGMPAFPITLTWPWLGPLGLIPFPVKYSIYFGEPLFFEGDPDEEDALVEKKVDAVKRTIQRMLIQGLRERRSVFF
jgi:1-acyl-sn-glycerol-3-phosphate acyltransferase